MTVENHRYFVRDVIEQILERLPVKSLIRFKSVSTNWKSTIESPKFQKKQLIRRKQARGPDVLLVSVLFTDVNDDRNTDDQRFIVGSSIISTVWLPVWCSLVCHGSCDGLLCLYSHHKPTTNYVVNPATGWSQTVPLSNVQQFLKKQGPDHDYPNPNLGFGKDKKGTYKPVCLYNSSEFDLNNVITCEIFDFSTNAWRYVVTAFPLRIYDWQPPLFLDGSLLWITSCVQEPKIISFDLYTETFQVICKVPLTLEAHDPYLEIMSILDNHLCLSEIKKEKKNGKELMTQVIWWYDSSGPRRKWKQLCSLNLNEALSCFKHTMNFPLTPVAIVDKNKILLQGKYCLEKFATYDLNANTYDIVPVKPRTRGIAVYYYQSLFSAK